MVQETHHDHVQEIICFVFSVFQINILIVTQRFDVHGL